MLMRSGRFHWCILFCCGLWCGSAELVRGQAGLREALERLDRDGDGEVEPHEITPQARPYLERIAAARRLSLDRDNDIEDLQEAARIYHAMQNGVTGIEVTTAPTGTVRGFGLEQDAVMVPAFGLPEVKYPYTPEDWEDAERGMRRSDRNNDGFIDRAEASDSPWRNIDPFEFDFNQDDRLSMMELVQRYARRRLTNEDSEELIQKVRRVGNGIREAQPQRRESDDNDQWWRRGGSSWLASSVLGRFDANRNFRLDGGELKNLGMPVARIDLDRDGELSRDELNTYLTEVQAEAGGEAEGLPGWFFELDQDRDGQISMAEFTPEWSAGKEQEFLVLDTNHDGLLTAGEVAHSRALMGGSYRNDTAEPIPPRKTIISEIEIDEDVIVGALKVRLSITHTQTGYLDGFLTSPSGQRVELFSEVGGSGDHFEETVLDDEAEIPINKVPAPFKGTFTTTAKAKRQPGLSQFSGQNARGVWQLVIRGTNNDRFGILHGWSLIVRPKETMLDAAPLPPPDQTATAERPAPASPGPTSTDSNNAAVSTPLAPLARIANSLTPTATDDERQKVRGEFRDQLKLMKLSDEDSAKLMQRFDNRQPSADSSISREEKKKRNASKKWTLGERSRAISFKGD